MFPMLSCVRYQAMELSPNLTQCGLGAEAYLRAKFHFDPPYHVATIHQRYRQTDRAGQDTQRSDSIGRTVLQTVAQKWMRLCFEKPY